MALIAKLNESPDPQQWRPKVTNLGLSTGKFESDWAVGNTMSVMECFTRKKDSEDAKRKSGGGDDDEVKLASELVPSLEEFDASIVELLPPKVRARVEERVRMLTEKSREKEGSPSSPSPLVDSATVSRVNSDKIGDACEKCGKVISPFDLPEHLDYHMAKELQSELRTAAVPKRKRSVDTDSDAQGKRQKNILSFLQRQ